MEFTDKAALQSYVDSLNASHLGLDLKQVAKQVGAKVANIIIDQYEKKESICFLCGKGINGLFGLTTALSLLQKDYEGLITVYLFTRVTNWGQPAGQDLLLELKKASGQTNNFNVVTDAKLRDIANHQLIVESITGNSYVTNLRKKYRDIIKRCTHFRSRMIALDSAVPGYTCDLSISLDYPKTADTKIVKTGIPAAVYTNLGPGALDLVEGDVGQLQRKLSSLLLIVDRQESSENYQMLTEIFKNKNLSEQLHQSNVELLSTEEVTINHINKADTIFLDLPNSRLANLGIINHILTNVDRESTQIIVSNQALETLLASGVEDLTNCVLIISSRNEILGNLFPGMKLPAGIDKWSKLNNCISVYIASGKLFIGGENLIGEPQLISAKLDDLALNSIEMVDLYSHIARYTAGSILPWLSIQAAIYQFVNT